MFIVAFFAVHWDDVHNDRVPPDYQGSDRFFGRTYLSKNLSTQAIDVVRRLSVRHIETSAVFNLATQFGGARKSSAASCSSGMSAINSKGKVILSREAIGTCNEYGDWDVDHRQQLPNWFPPDGAREQFADMYRFHPTAIFVARAVCRNRSWTKPRRRCGISG